MKLQITVINTKLSKRWKFLKLLHFNKCEIDMHSINEGSLNNCIFLVKQIFNYSRPYILTFILARDQYFTIPDHRLDRRVALPLLVQK